MHALLPVRGARMPALPDALPGAAPARALGRALGLAFGLLLAWRERGRQRAALATLDDRALRDIGVSRADIWVEADKPFWLP
jgi:uncharacterized protein YjiS (DUF1127 family)